MAKTAHNVPPGDTGRAGSTPSQTGSEGIGRKAYPLLSSAICIEADPQHLLSLSNELQRHYAHDARLSSPVKKVLKELRAVRVSCVGNSVSLGNILDELGAQAPKTTKALSQHLSEENLYSVSPFLELTQLPIGRPTEAQKAGLRPTFGQLFPAFGGSAEDETIVTAVVRPARALDEMPISHFRAKGRRTWIGGWGFPGLYYCASVRTFVSGYDAAYAAGGIYAAARHLYETLQGSDILIALLVAGALQVANSAPEVPWVSDQISVTTCSCAIVGGDGTCNFGDPSITEGQCHTETRSNVFQLESCFGNWGGGCGRTVAHYSVQFTEDRYVDFYGGCR